MEVVGFESCLEHYQAFTWNSLYLSKPMHSGKVNLEHIHGDAAEGLEEDAHCQREAARGSLLYIPHSALTEDVIFHCS